jgi:hypothetical protein
MQKKLESDYAMERGRALRQLEDSLNEAKKREIQQVNEQHEKRVEAEVKAAVAKELQGQEVKLGRDLTRQRAQEVERIKTEARRDKTMALAAQREKMEKQFATDVGALKADKQALTDELRRLKQEKAQTVESLLTNHRWVVSQYDSHSLSS